LLLAKQNSADANYGDFDKENSGVLASVDKMLDSLVQRMVKCEPEDFELVSQH
jgi:hypothetical protein